MKKSNIIIVFFLFWITISVFGVPAGAGELFFSPAIDADDDPATNPVIGIAVPVVDIPGGVSGLITLAAEVVPVRGSSVPINVPVTFSVWNGEQQVFSKIVKSDAWGAAEVQVYLQDINGTFTYRAEAPAYGSTEWRAFTFDPRVSHFKVKTGEIRLSYNQRGPGKTGVSLTVPGPDPSAKANLLVVRYLETAAAGRPGYKPSLPLPTLEMVFKNSVSAESEVRLPPGNYGLISILETGKKNHRYSYSQPVYLTINSETGVPAGVPVWASASEAAPGKVMVQYQAEPGRGVFALVDKIAVPAIPKVKEGTNLFTRTLRTGPFTWEKQDYKVSIQTVTDDGRKLISMEDFEYDPVACRYTLAIRSLQDIVIRDMLRIDVYGPGHILIKEEDVPVVLQPDQVFHYSFEVPAALGKPELIRVALDDPIDVLVSDLIALAKRLKVGGTVSASLSFTVTVVGWEILSWEYVDPPGTEIKGGYQPPDLEDIVKNILSDLFSLQFVIGSVSLSDDISFTLDVTFDAGKCPDPEAVARLEKLLSEVAYNANEIISSVPSFPSIDTPPFPIPVGPIVVQAWGELGAGVRGTASASGLTISIGAQLSAEGSFSVGWKLPGFDVDEIVDAFDACYKMIQAMSLIANIAATVAQMQEMVAQGDCDPDPPDPGPPDDRQDVWQGIEGFYQDADAQKTVENLRGLVKRSQGLNLELAEKFFTMRLREKELEVFISDTENYRQYLADMKTTLAAAQADLAGWQDGTLPLPPGLTLEEALYQRMEQVLTELNGLNYATEQKRITDALALAERFYQELRGQELQLQLELRTLFTSDVIGVLASGFAEATLSVLTAAGLPSQLVSPWPGNNSFRGKPALYLHPDLAPRAMVAPAGSLHMIASSPAAVSWLQNYVAGGGLLIVFTQAFGTDWAVLPGGEIRGVGYEEDQRCQHASVRCVTPSNWLVWMGVPEPDIQVDGAFTDWPAGTKILLERTRGTYANYPAMIEYDYGQGRVLATSAYGDWAWQANFWWGDEWQMTRSLLIRAWLLTHGRDVQELPAANPGTRVTVSVQVKNNSSETIKKADVMLPAQLSWMGATFTSSVQVSVEPGAEQWITTELGTPDVMRHVHNWTQVGLYHLRTRYTTESGKTMEDWADFVNVLSPVVIPAFSAGLTLGKPVTGPYQETTVDLTLTNNYDTPLTITLRGVEELPETPVTINLEPDGTAQYSWQVVMGVTDKEAAVEFLDSDGVVISRKNIHIPITLPVLKPELLIPDTIGGGTEISVSIKNTGVVPAPACAAACRLYAPDNAELWSAVMQFPEIAAGDSAVSGTVIDLPSVMSLGTYRLEYTVITEWGEIKGRPALLPHNASIDLIFHGSGQIRNPLNLTMQIKNTGTFNLTADAGLAIPDCAWQSTVPVSITGKSSWEGNYTVILPETLETGSYAVQYTLSGGQQTLISGSETFFVPQALVTASGSEGPYAAGTVIPLTLVNSGGVDALLTHYTVNLLGMHKNFSLADTDVALTIQVNSSGIIESQVYPGTASGAYVLNFSGILDDGNTVSYSRMVQIAGPEISVDTMTDAQRYLTRDNITVETALINNGVELADGRLELKITKADLPIDPALAWQNFLAGNEEMNNCVEAMAVDSTGNIWMAIAPPNYGEGTFNRDINIYNLMESALYKLHPDLITWEAVPLPEELTGAHIIHITAGTQGRMWFATNRGAGLLAANGTDWTVYQAAEPSPPPSLADSPARSLQYTVPLASNTVTAVAVDSAANTWFGTDNGLSVLSADGAWTGYTTGDGLVSDFIYAIAFDAGNNAWIATDNGISRLSPGGVWFTYNTENGLLSDHAVDLVFDRKGNLWIATQGSEQGGVSVLLADDTWEYYYSGTDIDYANINSLAVDKFNRKWIGYAYGGVDIVSADNSRIDHYDYNEMMAEYICDIASAPGGDVWVGYAYGWWSGEGNVVRAYPGPYTWEAFSSVDSGLPYYAVDRVAVDPEGNIWMSGYDYDSPSVTCLDSNATAFSRIPLPNENYGGYVNDIAFDAAGNTWLATNDGLAMLTHSRDNWTTWHLTGAENDPPLLSNYIDRVAVDNRGNVWLSTYDGLQGLTPEGTWLTYTSEEDLASGYVYDIACDPAGNLWLGTSAGLIRRSADGAWKFYTDGDGIPQQDVYRLVIDAAGNIWMINRDENWQDIITVLYTDGTTRILTTADGLRSSNIQALIVDKQGNLWVAHGYQGIVVYSPGMVSLYEYRGFDMNYRQINEMALAPDGDVWFAVNSSGGESSRFLDMRLCLAGYSDIAIHPGDYEGQTIGLLHASAADLNAAGGVLWERTVAANVLTGGTQQDSAELTAASLNATGKFNLEARVFSPTEQQLAEDYHAFYVFPVAAGLLLETDKPLYKTGETVSLSGTLFNDSELAIADQTITVTRDDEEIAVYGPVTLQPGERYPLELQLQAPDLPGKLLFTAAASIASVSTEAVVAVPQATAELIVPDLTSTAPFTAAVLITNTGLTSVEAAVSIAGSSNEAVNLAPGASILVNRTLAITENTIITAHISGDLERELTAPVALCDAPFLEWEFPADGTAGVITVPYTLTGNNQLRVTVVWQLAADNGSQVSETAVVEPGQVLTGQLELNLEPGRYHLTGTLRDIAGNSIGEAGADILLLASIEPALAGINLTRFAVNPLPVMAGNTTSAELTLENNGASRDVLIGLQLFGIEKQWVVTPDAFAVSDYTFPLAIPADTPTGSYPGELRIDDMSRSFTVSVTGSDVEMTLALDKAWYTAGEEAELTVDLAEKAGLALDYNLSFRCQDAEDQVTVPVAASGTARQIFKFTVSSTGRVSVTLSHIRSDEFGERVITIDSLAVPVIPAAGSYLTADKTLYEPGETVNLTIHITDYMNHFVVQGPLELGLKDDSYFILWPQTDWKEDGLVRPGTYGYVYTLPAQMRSGRYTFLMQADNTSYSLQIDVKGTDVTSRRITLDKVRYSRNDVIRAEVEFVNHGTETLSGLVLSGLVFPPGDASAVPLELPHTINVNLAPGLNTFVLKGSYNTQFTGPHRLLVTLAPECCAPRTAAAAVQFDVGDSYVVGISTNRGSYQPGEAGTARLDVYGTTPTHITVESSNETVLFDQTLALAGFQSLTIPFQAGTSADYLLIAKTTDADNNTDQQTCTFTVPAPLDTMPPVITITSPAGGYVITDTASEYIITVEGTVTDDGQPVTLVLNGSRFPITESGAFSLPVTVKRGSNRISAAAIDAAGNTTFAPGIEVFLLPDRETSLSTGEPLYYVGQQVVLQTTLTAADTFTDVALIQTIPAALAGTVEASASTGNLVVTNNADQHRISWQGDVSQPVTITVTAMAAATGDFTSSASTYWGWGYSTTATSLIKVTDKELTVEAGSDITCSEGDTVIMQGSFSDSPIGAPQSINWDFGDGTTADGTLTPDHVYGDNGDYTVTLTVSDSRGMVKSDTLTVTVQNVAPVVNAGPDLTVMTDEKIYLHAAYTDPGSLDTHTLVWDFGDGSSAYNITDPVYSYAAAGHYTITLTVTDDDGDSTSDTIEVTVRDQEATGSTVYVSNHLYACCRAKITTGHFHSDESLKLSAGFTLTGDAAVKGDVYLQKGSRLNGDLTYTGRIKKEKGAVIQGTVTREKSIELPVVETKKIPYGRKNWIVRSRRYNECPAGNYRDVVVYPHQTLILRAGVYNFKSLSLKKNARLIVDAAGGEIFINVDAKISLYENVKIRLMNNSRATFYTNTCKLLYIKRGVSWEGDIIAPHTNLYMYPGTRISGSVFTRSLFMNYRCSIAPLQP